MRVLIIGSSRRVGLTFHFTVTAIAMKGLGIDVTVVSPRKYQFNELPEMLEKAGIELFVVDEVDSMKPYDMARANFGLYRVLKDFQPDAVIAEGITQLTKTGLYRLVKHEHDIRFISIAGSIPIHNTKIYLQLLDKFVDYTISLCQYTKRILLTYGFNSRKIIVTPLFAPYLPFFDKLKNGPLTDFRKYGLDNIEGPVIFYAAYHHPWKGFEYYLLATRKVLQSYDATFILGGTGPITNKLKQLANKLGIINRIIFTGFIPFYDLYPILHNVVDIAVSTSLREQFPSYILEVMASEKPIVATNVGGVPEQVFNGYNGFLVEPRDHEAVANRIIDLIENDALRVNMGLNGRKIIERWYNREHAIDILLDRLEKKP